MMTPFITKKDRDQPHLRSTILNKLNVFHFAQNTKIVSVLELKEAIGSKKPLNLLLKNDLSLISAISVFLYNLRVGSGI